ncbi:WD repeat protein [Niveomyces insectorum RCEF 264]|uniref:WD repeat protein n=1 Tax=Niveomyces insectorum RCEF 264 TaxID=1081102 RepID=A0A162KH18_9HYPO|nr:WD repeat protein [Niveomyces insectorum RCEF 264]
MASTPSNRLKLTPSNSPFMRTSRSPIRSRTLNDASTAASSTVAPRLSLKRVVGSTCCAPTGFDTVGSSFAYIAGGAVVVVDVHSAGYRQRFYRARPSAVPVYSVSPVPHGPSTPNSTPKANDSRNRSAAAGGHRESAFGVPDWVDSPTSGKTWTQRERIKSATCLSLSRNGRFLAVGETGYAPRVLIFSLDDTSSDIPLVSISEHSFGVTAVAWSADSRYLASLGTANDGFLYLWKIDARTGAAKLFQQNRCTSYVRGMIWLGSSSLITFGVRHIKVWRVEDASTAGTSPTKSKHANDIFVPVSPLYPQQQQQQQQQQQLVAQQHQQSQQLQPQQKTLPGRNILLGSLLEATFSCAAPLPDGRAVICSETGDICVLETINKQLKLTRLRDVGFPVTCLSIRQQMVHIGSKAGQSLAITLDDLLSDSRRDEQQKQQRPFTPSKFSAAAAVFSSPFVSSRRSSLPRSAHDGLVAMGFLTNHVVTVDTKQSIDIFSSAEHVPGTKVAANVTQTPIPGHGEPIMGIQALSLPNRAKAAFFTWCGSGKILLWNLDGEVQSSLQIPVEQVPADNDLHLSSNQLSVVRATKGGKLFVTADRLGVLRIMDFATQKFVLETKAHASDCQSISVYENDKRLLLATCGRDRTAQLFHRLRNGTVEHFQTLEFAAKVVQVLISPDDKIITCSFDRTLQVYDLVAKEDEPDVIAAVPARVITLKASPSSMTLSPDTKSIFVSLLDRTICQYELATSRLMSSFKCIDEGGTEAAVLDALIYGTQSAGPLTSPPLSPAINNNPAGEIGFLLGVSNTDKSVRIYDAQTGAFLDREWGHTEAINGVALIENEERLGDPTKRKRLDVSPEDCRKVVSVGSDGTIMVWSLDLRDPVLPTSSASRDPSPVKEGNGGNVGSLASSKPPLRRVLSKAELAEFQRPSTSGGGGGGGNSSRRRSPSRSLSRRSSKYNLTVGAGPAVRTPISVLLHNPASAIAEDSPSRRASAGSGSGSPPIPASPKARVRRRPSLPAMSTASTPTGSSGGAGVMRKKNSASNLRSSYGFGSLNMATEQTCRQLRAYRKRLASADPVAQDTLVELDQELRLTMAALGDRAIRSKAMTEELGGLLDEKLERLVSLLDEKWRLHQPKQAQSPTHRSLHRHRHDRDGSAGSAGSGGSGGSGDSGESAGSEDRERTAGTDDRSSSNSADTDNTSPDENSRPTSMAGSVRIL